MPIRGQSQALLLAWAQSSGIEFETLMLDSMVGGYDPDLSPNEYLQNTVEITVIYGGAFDESFYMQDTYARRLVDEVLVPDLKREASEEGLDSPWHVLIHRVSGEHGDYREPELMYEVRGGGSE